MSDLHTPNGRAGGPVRFTWNITLGSLIASAMALGPGIYLILWFGDLGNVNNTQNDRFTRVETSISQIISTMVTDDEAKAGRERRDAQIEGLQRVQETQQKGFDQAFDGVRGRMDRVFERLDALQTTVTELKTTIQIMNRQSRLESRGGFDAGASPPIPGGVAR